MKGILKYPGAALLCALVGSFSFAYPMAGATAGNIFTEDFEGYINGTFPASGGWILVYDGAGSTHQYIDDSHSVSPSHSLHLEGSFGWSALAFRPVNLPSHVILEAMVYVNEIVFPGIAPNVATVGLRNPGIGLWGTGFGRVTFNCDGNIYAIQDDYHHYKNILLFTEYEEQTWYHVMLDIDLEGRSYDVYIDGILCGLEVQILNTGMPTGVSLCSAFGQQNPIVWFDDIKITPPTLFKDNHNVSARIGGTVNFTLDAGPDNSGRDYLLLGGITGTEPGMLLPYGNTLPLNEDRFTNFVYSMVNTQLFQNFMGTLGDSAATATLNAPGPLPPVTAGLTVYFAYALNKPWDFASNPVAIGIVP